MIGRLRGRGQILSDRESELRIRESELLDRLTRVLERFGPDLVDGDRRRLEEARESLHGFFLLVVAGEYNSGKSSFINALLGERVLPEGVTPTTDRVNLLRHGPEVSERPLREFLLERTHPAEILREINVVDTPGTNAVIREHEELTRDFVPRSDLILFVTSADRPFTESERAFLAEIRDWGKKIVFVVNKVDILAGPDEVEQVTGFVREHGARLLGATPRVFAVSSRAALSALGDGGGRAESESGFEEVEEYLLRTLDEEERVRLKLLNPLNVALRLAGTYRETAYERLKLLAADVEAIANIDRQLAAFHEEMLRELEPRLARVELLLNDMEARGIGFFDEHVRIGRIRGLLSSDDIRRAFEREVIAETPQRIDEEVGRIIDWIVERNLRVWQDIERYIDRRQVDRHREGMVGEVGQSFNYNRQALLDSVGRLSKEVVGGYDREAESRALANDVHGAFATTALAEAGAVGLGTVLVVALGGAAADVTGVLLAATLAVGGLYVIPQKRKRVKADFRRRMSELRARLTDALTRQVHHEIAESTDRINQAIAPYRRFVETQRKDLGEARDELVVVEDALKRLRGELERA
jgi:GTP-binding protein EngB required for normal cell division